MKINLTSQQIFPPWGEANRLSIAPHKITLHMWRIPASWWVTSFGFISLDLEGIVNDRYGDQSYQLVQKIAFTMQSWASASNVLPSIFRKLAKLEIQEKNVKFMNKETWKQYLVKCTATLSSRDNLAQALVSCYMKHNTVMIQGRILKKVLDELERNWWETSKQIFLMLQIFYFDKRNEWTITRKNVQQ